MTTTAFDDQFTVGTQTIEPVRQPYDTVAILRRNIADMEVALRTQTERAEAAEAELARLREQKPIKYLYRVIDCFGHDVLRDDPRDATIIETIPLYAAPIPAPHKGATHCDDCGLTWLDDGLNPLRCPYCKDAVPAPAVPAEIMALSKKYAIDTDAYHAAMDALLQSAPAPAVPDGWTEWNGGDIPPVRKDDQRNYEFLRRDGQLAAFVTSWQHGIEGIGARDIVAYRRKDCLLQSAEVSHD